MNDALPGPDAAKPPTGSRIVAGEWWPEDYRGPPLLSFEAGIAARETRGETESVEFLFPPRADLEGATAEGDKAVAKVRFLAELRSRVTKASGETSDATTGEPLVEERRTAEHWTFERTLGATDPNWVLARVEPANA